jgi:hypothetical protein
VSANPTTGSVLVLFEPNAIGPDQIVQRLQHIDCLTSTGNLTAEESLRKGVGQKLVETLVQSAFEMVVQRAIMRLI